MSSLPAIGHLGPATGWHVSDLERACGLEDCRFVPLDFPALSAALDCGHEEFRVGAIPPLELDAILVRAMPRGTLEQVIHRMDVLGRLEARGARLLNRPRAIECAVDKYLSLARLAAAGLPVPPTRSTECARQARMDFEQLGGDVVVKPLFGSEGQGLLRVKDPQSAREVFEQLEEEGRVIYQQAFVDHPGWDLRLLVARGEVLGAMRREKAPGEAWRTNMSCGATARALTAPREVEQLALEAARVLGIELAGVDLVPGPDGEFRVLELNSAPGWRHLARVTGRDLARAIIRLALSPPED